MRRILISIFLIVCGLTALGSSKKGSAAKLIDHASYGAYALNAETGEVISQTSQISLVPASVMKIITTATALQILGPDFTFHTRLGYSGKVDQQNETLTGNLILKGGGVIRHFIRSILQIITGELSSNGLRLSLMGA